MSLATRDIPTRKLRVLYLIDYWGSPGGTERHLAYLLESLDRTRFECRVVVFNYLPNALAETARASGISIDHIPLARYYTPSGIKQALALLRYMRAHEIDIVQTFHFKSDVVGATVARLAGIRHVVSSKRDAADYKRTFHFLLNRLVRPLTERYIAVSRVVAEVIRKREGVPDSRISTIYNGVDLVRHVLPTADVRARARAALGFNDTHFVIGMSAWFRPEKDHGLLFGVFQRLLERTPSVRLLLVGGGPLLEHYRAFIQGQPGLADTIHFAGPVDDVRPFLHAMDVGCLIPSSNEGFSNSVLEKMAAGLPLVVTRIGGNAEAVVDGVTGFVIPPGASEQLENRLTRLHVDSPLRHSMSTAARKRVEEHFSLDRMIQQHETLYLNMTSA